MRLMLIGTDRTLFTEGSAVRRRLTLFGEHYTDALDSIVFSTRSHGISDSQELSPRVHAHPTNSWSRLLYGFDAIRIARRLPKPDIVSAQDPFETGLTALFIAQHFHIPYMVEIHTDFLSPAFVRHSLLNRLRVCLAGFVLARAAGGYAVSESIRERVRVRYPQAPLLNVFPIYVDTKSLATTVHIPHPRFKTALLWVGRLEPEKSPGRALDALILARREGFDVGLTFAGSGQLGEHLRAKAVQEGVGEWVEFVGWVDLPPYYAQADLLLVTSEYEGYGMTIVEALAAHVPVLSTDVGIAREAGATIALGDYPHALLAWLGGSRAPGVLQLQAYASEEEYFSRVRDAHEVIIHTSRA